MWEGSEQSINQFSFIDTVNDQIFEAIQRGGSKEAIKKSYPQVKNGQTHTKFIDKDDINYWYSSW